MAELYLHVGHGKTGSSFAQSSFALSHKSLEEKGIYYPPFNSFELARQGKITSGNGALLYNIDKLEIGNHKKIFLSNEVLFHDILEGKLDRSLELLANGLYEKVHVILFIRDLVDHAESSYQQVIKRGGATVSVEDFFAHYSQPKLVAELLERFSHYPNFEVTVKNYSSCRNGLLTVFSEWLGVEDEVFSNPPVRQVNRSMTRPELRFQKSVNEILGQSGSLVSDPLCDLLPEIKSEKYLPSKEVQENMLLRLSGFIQQVNCFVDEDNKYTDTVCEVPSQDLNLESYCFDGKQIDVIASSISSEILKLRKAAWNTSVDSLSSYDINIKPLAFNKIKDKFGVQAADMLRDLAICFEDDDNNLLALLLMNAALKARPEGKFIQKKVKDYLSKNSNIES